jgi:mRNA-degrading endonuclease RelE of RelBE toxin-antitoxin system
MALMSDEMPQVEIFFSDDFQSRLRTLAKRYRNIRSDLQLFLDEIQSGNFIGDRVTKTGSVVFKVRLQNSDIQKGKSGGYRVIYQLRNNTCVLLIVIYSKSDQEDFTADQIREIIAIFDEQTS